MRLVLLDRDVDTQCDRVNVDHRGVAYSAISHLPNLGRRDILLATGSEQVRPGPEGYRGR